MNAGRSAGTVHYYPENNLYEISLYNGKSFVITAEMVERICHRERQVIDGTLSSREIESNGTDNSSGPKELTQ